MNRLFILLSLSVTLLTLTAWKDPQINTQAPASIAAPASCLDTAGQHLNWVSGAFTCGTTNSYVPLSGTSTTQNPGIMIVLPPATISPSPSQAQPQARLYSSRPSAAWM